MTLETYARLPKTDFAGYERLGWPTNLNPHEYPYHIDHEYIVMGQHYEQYHIYLLSLDNHPNHIIVKFKSPSNEVQYKPMDGTDDKVLFTIDGDKYELHMELK